MDQAVTAEGIEQAITQFVSGRVKAEVPADEDLFASGLVSSMFAMELVVHLEQAFSVQILGDDLKRDNFRTVQAMTALVARLRGVEQPADA
ncbi:acyl carrier protein [Streptomyces samsunensis]|uniref:Carrier domain-containing protein n=4 Tax=Streptomyces TaxID=1883 RepID=A0A2J7Z1N2_STRMQ|nr:MULTISPECIES: phosphopantetheine-binding protein [Streptomyces]AGZ78438.1 FkbJ [Streptomyces sp. RJA2928]WJJ61197.1 acyl carrier protein [Streptomyces sp.]MCC4317222.1 phosphopantetheine-binding protein [Streptomyces malaysiensis]MCD9586794.1 phosphopantetheine-binding protein [Streptomyces sp. 8ZJF_21]MCM3806940.1 phosphopantetheine-binding protein [Streptomyces sp. DR7-3]